MSLLMQYENKNTQEKGHDFEPRNPLLPRVQGSFSLAYSRQKDRHFESKNPRVQGPYSKVYPRDKGSFYS